MRDCIESKQVYVYFQYYKLTANLFVQSFFSFQSQIFIVEPAVFFPIYYLLPRYTSSALKLIFLMLEKPQLISNEIVSPIATCLLFLMSSNHYNKISFPVFKQYL